MSVKLSVPAELLVRPDVSQAVQALILALGGREKRAVKAAPRPVAKARRPATPPTPLPAPTRAAPTTEKMTLDEFVSSLPANSRRFIEIVKERGVIKASEMVPLLGLKNAKAVGGITGAIGRWGPARGVELPYERITLEGERAWRWLTDENGKRREVRTAPAVPVTPISFPLPAPAPRRTRKSSKATKSATKPQKKARKAKAAPAAAAEKPTTVDGILDSLAPKPRALADALKAGGSLDSASALSAAGLTAIGQLNAMIREINKAASHLGQKLVSDDLDLTGSVSYRWLGLQPVAPPVEETASPDESGDDYVARGGLIRRRRRA